MDITPGIGSNLFFILLSLVLVAINGFFVATEFAIVKVRRTRLVELAGQGISSARVSLLCVEELDESLSATQLGITLVSLGLGWIGEESFFGLFASLFPSLASTESRAHAIALGASFLVITMLHVVLGELVPKSMAIQRAEQVALFVARPLRIFYSVAKPLIRTFTWLANAVLQLSGFGEMQEPPLSEEELRLVMKESHEEGVVSESEAQIISKALSFSDKRACDIMVQARDVQFLSMARSLENNLATARQRMYTRFPLVKSDLREIIGVVHMKDALAEITRNATNEAFAKTARPVVYVTPQTRQDQLLKIFRERKTHLAVVRNTETGDVRGIVTLEDVLEELVGEIVDEHGN